MIHLRQPKGSRVCGQTCVAMLAGVGLEQAIDAVGTEGATSYNDLRRGLSAFGLRGGRHVLLGKQIPPLTLRGIVGVADDAQAAIKARDTASSSHWGGHWVAVAAGKVWDPDPVLAPVVDVEAFALYLGLSGLKFTSFMPVTPNCGTPSWSRSSTRTDGSGPRRGRSRCSSAARTAPPLCMTTKGAR